LLIEAAIKNVHRTKQAWKEQKYDDGVETLSRAQDIIAEILCSLDKEGSPEIAPKLASIYLFIFRRLAEGGMSHDEQKLDDALRVLNSERETWRLVCEKFGSMVGQTAAGAPASGHSVKLDSAGSAAAGANGTRVLVPPSATGTTNSGTFARPSFAQGVRPLGASGIQTDSSLAGAKPIGKTPLDLPVPEQPTKPTTPVSGSGNSWDA
jgi:flagellar protein FliS